MEVGRGDLVVAVFAGDYGKPRPALVAQSDAFSGLESVTLLPLTSDLRDWPEFRISIEPTRENGLRERSDVMIDKATTVSRDKVRQQIGRLDLATMRIVSAALTRFLGLD
jgi:mRNA interferase MazF